MAFSYRVENVLATTTPTLQGYRIVEYKGVVTGETVIGANIFRDLFAAVRDIVGGRSGAYESALNDARRIAMDEMREDAQKLDANAVIGIDIDYETINNMMIVCVSGTAVQAEKE